MHGFSSNEAVLYATIWTVGALAALARALRDADGHDLWSVLGACMCGGFLAVSFTGILSAHFPGQFGTGGYHLGVASLVGLLGKSTDFWTRSLLSFVMRIRLPATSDELKS